MTVLRHLLLLIAVPFLAACGDDPAAPTPEQLLGSWELEMSVVSSCQGFAERRRFTFTVEGAPDADGRLSFSSTWGDGTPYQFIAVATGTFDVRERTVEIRFERFTGNAARFRGVIWSDGSILGRLVDPADPEGLAIYAGSCDVQAKGRRTGPAPAP